MLVLLPLVGTLGLLFTQDDALASPTWVGKYHPCWQQSIVLAGCGKLVDFPRGGDSRALWLTLSIGLVLATPRLHARWYRTIIDIPSLIPDVAYALALDFQPDQWSIESAAD